MLKRDVFAINIDVTFKYYQNAFTVSDKQKYCSAVNESDMRW